MRNHAQAPSAGSNQGAESAASSFRRAPIAFLCALVLTGAALFGASSALAAAPALTVGSPSAVSYTSAHVSGTIDPEANGSSIFWYFQYSTEPANPGSWVSGASGLIEETDATGTAPLPVSGDLGGLQPGEEYSVRLFAYYEGFGASVETEAPYPSFNTVPVGPPAVSIATPSAVTASTAQFSGEIDPEAPAGNPGAFDVQWNFVCTPECPHLVGGTIPADSSGHPVSASATGLKPGVAYQVSLVATNAGGPATAGPQSFTTPVMAPQLRSAAAHVTATAAALTGKVNPNGGESTYHFEYGPTATYGEKTADGTLFAGNTAEAISANLSGLSPATEYHFRLVASNSAGTTEGPDRTFVTQPAGAGSCPNEAFRIGASASLPDCRAYELVSPAGLDFDDFVRVPSVSDDGNHASFLGLVPGDDAHSALIAASVVSNRTAAGWVTADANPNVGIIESIQNSLPIWPSADFKKMILLVDAPLAEDDWDSGFADLYRLDVGQGTTSWLTFSESNLPDSNPVVPALIGASPDLGRVVFHTAVSPLVPGGPSDAIYERDSNGLALVSVLPDGSPAGYATPAVGNGVGFARPIHGGVHGVSDDGSRVFFFNNFIPTGPLYMRNVDTETTVAISASQRAGEVGVVKEASNFLFASHDGGVVYFSSTEQLTDAATPGGGIYRYVVGTDSLEQITPATARAESLTLNGVVSDDGSHIYFSSPQQLTPDAADGGPNLYVWSGGVTRFITTAVASVERVSRDGRYAVLGSSESIDGAPNDGHAAIYEYDDATGDIACASCRADGSPSQQDSNLVTTPFATSAQSLIAPRNISDDGRVFFNSLDRLIPADQTFSQDVYEYDNGKVSLLTSGQGDDNQSYIADNSDDGRNVFFLSRSAFLPQDRDAVQLDLYDARIDGGFPTPPPAAPGCEGEACRTGTSAAPAAAAPVTPGFVGPGNAKSGRNQDRKHQKHRKKRKHRSAHKRDANRNGRTGR